MARLGQLGARRRQRLGYVRPDRAALGALHDSGVPHPRHPSTHTSAFPRGTCIAAPLGTIDAVVGVKKRAPARKKVSMASIESEPLWEPEAQRKPGEFVCPICGSDDVADVTTPVDLVPVGLCANGHRAVLHHHN
jgi:hypothetical protein